MHHLAIHRSLKLVPLALALALGLVVAGPAHADFLDCWEYDPATGEWVQDAGKGENQGPEHGTMNTTCHYAAAGYGHTNNASGEFSAAFGYQNTAKGHYSSTFGRQNTAEGTSAAAFGSVNTAKGFYSNAFGGNNTAEGETANAFGYHNTAQGKDSDAFGTYNTTTGEIATAFGRWNVAAGKDSNAFGNGNTAGGGESSAFGYKNTTVGTASSVFGHTNSAVGDYTHAFGDHNTVNGRAGMAFGAVNRVDGEYATAFGSGNSATGHYSNVVGSDNTASGDGSIAFGSSNSVSGASSIAVGRGNTASGDFGSAFGHGSVAAGESSLAIGREARATDRNTIAIGTGATVLAPSAAGTVRNGGMALGDNASVAGAATNAVAIGASSVASEAGTVSIGDTGNERRLVHVAAGTNATDAVNISQLYSMGSTVASYFGGGAAFANGVWTPPTFVIQGGSHGNVGDAFTAVDGVLSSLDTRVTGLEARPPDSGTPGAKGAPGDSAYEVAMGNGFTGTESEWLSSLVGATGPQGPAGTGGSGLTEGEVKVIATDVADAGDASTLADATAYTDGREDAIRADVVAGDEATLTAANQYTDTAIQQIVGFDVGDFNERLDALEGRFENVNRRLHQQNRRIDRTGAMSAAMMNMAINAAGTQSDRGRIAIGAGFQGGQRGLSVGYGKRIGRASLSLSGAFSGSDRSTGIGFGVDL